MKLKNIYWSNEWTDSRRVCRTCS